jgi:hypothetical protein
MPTRSRALPPFPAPPQTVSRFDHPPTVEVAALYWREALARERARGDRGTVRTAEAIVASYEAARHVPRSGDLADF